MKIVAAYLNVTNLGWLPNLIIAIFEPFKFIREPLCFFSKLLFMIFEVCQIFLDLILKLL